MPPEEDPEDKQSMPGRGRGGLPGPSPTRSAFLGASDNRRFLITLQLATAEKGGKDHAPRIGVAALIPGWSRVIRRPRLAAWSGERR